MILTVVCREADRWYDNGSVVVQLIGVVRDGGSVSMFADEREGQER